LCPAEPEISQSVVVQEAQRMGQTIMQYQGVHPVADEPRMLAKEFEDRLARISSERLIRLTTEAEVVHA
jgi:cellulose biosynthesis protein BcsQ